MITFLGYRLIDQLYESAKTLVYRGERESDQVAVVIKLLKAEYPSLRELMQFRHEYKVSKNLNLPGVVKLYSLENYHNGFALVMEDFGAISLKDYITQYPAINLSKFLNIALRIVQILEGLFCNQIIHKDLKPQHILINPETFQVKLIDFGIACLLPREKQELQTPDILEGTLAYMSPEQTGRMNRKIDYRTDFYSLGVTFYELLTGQLPFQSTDPMELVHCHIARKPTPPQALNATIPQVVNDIVLKLMAKTAQERYQSALGLRYDLERCLEQYSFNGSIQSFALGDRDISDHFQIPDNLYGRETEVAALLAAFDRVSASATELILVAGFSGIGKTALVHEVHRPIVRQRGYFIKGKFDQFKRNIPFSALVQALKNLMRQLLTESATQVERWKAEILSALGENAQVIINVIPELEQIIKKQPPVADLTSSAAHNRFNLLFGKFIRVFATKEHPLVIFLDDLQWADSASLKLIQLLMSEADTRHLLLIGAYRDNEVSPVHPLMQTLEEIRTGEATVNQITLSPLDQSSLNHLIADTLSCPPERAIPLTEQVLQKTQGNPFFSNQFLQSLYQDGLISFDLSCGYWQCDIAQVRGLSVSCDVVEFMALQLRKLPENTQDVLKLAACIGNQFDLATLSIVQGKPQFETATDLWRALQKGLILPITEVYKFFQDESALIGQDTEPLTTDSTELTVPYKFVHDRVQQAAYSLIPENQKASTHLKIGRLLWKNSALEEREDKIFEIVNQLNIGVGLITHPIERDELAQLNLLAGRKAKASTAYDAAARYLRVGMKLLPIDSWQMQYDLTLALHEIATEVAYLNGYFEQMEQLAELVLQQARTLLDKVKVYEVKIQSYQAQNKLPSAVETALQVLNLLGLKFPDQPSQLNVLLSLVGTKLATLGRDTEKLIHLSEMTDPIYLAVMRILSAVGSAAYFAAPNLYPLIVFKQVNLSIKYGNIPVSAFAYATYGSILCGILGEIDAGYRFGQLALSLVEQLNAQDTKTRTLFVVNCLIRHWKEHLRETLQPFQDIYQIGLATGDLEFASLSAILYGCYSYFTGTPLASLEQEIAAYCQTLSELKQETALYLNNLYRQTVLNLMGCSANPTRLVGDIYDEQKMLPLHQKANDRTAIYSIYFHQLILCYLFQDYSQALANASMAQKYLDGVTATFSVVLFHFYDSLSQLAVYDSVPKSKQKHILKKVTANQRRLKKWAEQAPMNHLHKFYLVEAERHRVLRQQIEAIDDYDRAIAGAKEQGYVHEEALANELAAKFYLGWGKETIAQTYLTHAYYTYARWGARAKVEDLEKRYLELLVPVLNTKTGQSTSEGLSHTTDATSTFSIPGGSAILDLETAIAASQALFREIQLEQLLSTLMKMLLENAGAQKGVLILIEGDKRVIAAHCVATQEVSQQVTTISGEGEFKVRSLPVEMESATSLPQSREVPVTLINYVEHTQETLMIEDVTALGKMTDENRMMDASSSFQLPPSAFQNDPYIIQQQPKSVLCTPICNQGKLIGILYLENNLTTGAFTSDRLAILRILTSQAAISLENARLYERIEDYSRTLEVKVEQRTHQLQEEVRNRISAEEALRQSEEKFFKAFCSSPISIGITTFTEGRYIEVNDSFLRMTGYSREEVIGSTADDLNLVGNLEEVVKISQQLQATGAVRDLEFHYRTKSCEVRTALMSCEIIDLAGQACILTVSKDITDRKQVEEELQQAKETAEVANLTKSEFLANMSHELRTPLNAILGFTQVMNRDASVSPERREYLDIINRSGQHLLKLINDILEMSKIEAGRVMLNENSCDLYRLLDSLEEMLRLKATAKELSLIFDCAPNVPQYITTDESKLRQVLLNLLGNAIKFTQVGSVTLRVRCREATATPHRLRSKPVNDREHKGNKQDSSSPPTTDNHTPYSLQHNTNFTNTQSPLHTNSSVNPCKKHPCGAVPYFLLFEVEDTGSGIAAEEMSTLFDAFVQTEAGRRSQEGTGLGLPISRKFVQLMGGDITVNSVVGNGSVFAFDIRVNLAEAIKMPTQSSTRQVIGLAPDQPVYRLLIVEDTWEHRQLLIRLLAPLGFEVQAAENGQEGVALWKSWEPHLILMDMRMPVMDGYEATKRIKATTAGQATIIIALTASAWESQRSLILSAGCDDFISKPFREEEIFDRLSKHLGVRYIYEEPAQATQNPSLDSQRLTREDLAVMPNEWLQKLHEAAMECNDDHIFPLLEQIPSEYITLATALSELTYNFRYEELIELTTY